MSNAIVRRAFESRLATFAATRNLPVAWENAKFDPPATAYLRAFMLPAPTLSSTLDRRHREYAGIFQVSVIVPLLGGVGPAQAIVDGVCAAFPVSEPMMQDGLPVWLREPMSQGPNITESDRLTVPVSTSYRLDAE